MRHPLSLRSLRCWAAACLALTLWPTATPAAEAVDPFGTCCVAKVVMNDYKTWTATCGSCAANPGEYAITQPDPDKLVFTGPGGVSADSPFDAAVAVCNCPSQDALRAREKKMRTFDGN